LFFFLLLFLFFFFFFFFNSNLFFFFFFFFQAEDGIRDDLVTGVQTCALPIFAPPHPTRIAVVGTGAVGSTFAFALLLSGLAAEIVLSDANERRAEGEAMDLMHAVPFARTARVWSGPVEECRGAAVTVIAAGAAQKPGETRLDLVAKNAAIFRDLVPRIAAANPDGIILVATNPV